MVRGVRRITLQDLQQRGVGHNTTPYQLQQRLNEGSFDLRFYKRR